MINTYRMFDTILLGASNENIRIAKELHKLNKNYIIIAAHVKNPTHCANLNIVYDIVKYIDYSHGIIRLTTDSALYCCVKVVISTGSRHATIVGAPNSAVFYRLSDVSVINSDAPGILIGTGDEVVKAACKLAKKSRYIYICNKDQFTCSNKMQEKLNSTKNIIVLNNTEIIKYKLGTNNCIAEVKFNTYDTIKCGYILALTERVPVVPTAVTGMFALSSDNKIIINSQFETTLMPNIYAIGECTTQANSVNWRTILNKL